MEMGFDWFGYSWSDSSFCSICVTFGYYMYLRIDKLKFYAIFFIVIYVVCFVPAILNERKANVFDPKRITEMVSSAFNY